MSIETSLAAHLAENVPLAGGRVHPAALPQRPSLPALVYLRVSGVPTYDHDGPTGTVEARFQVSCWATRYGTARQLAAQVRSCLEGYKGLMGDTEIGHCFCVADRDAREAEPGLYHDPLEFTVMYYE